MSRTKQSIAIIGAGREIGSMIADRISGENYRLLLFDDHPVTSKKIQRKLIQNKPAADIDIIECKHEACWEADIIILAVPFEKLKEVTEMIRDVATQKIVISISEALIGQNSNVYNYTVQMIQNLLPHSKIVHVYNEDDSEEKGNLEKVFLVGRDSGSVQEVKELLTIAGLNPTVTEEATF